MKRKHVTLHIDTSVMKEAFVVLIIDGQKHEKRATSETFRAQAVLPLIVTSLTEWGLALTDITEITAVTGPGSFTGLRVGLAVANALGVLLDIPVNGKKALATAAYS